MFHYPVVLAHDPWMITNKGIYIGISVIVLILLLMVVVFMISKSKSPQDCAYGGILEISCLQSYTSHDFHFTQVP